MIANKFFYQIDIYSTSHPHEYSHSLKWYGLTLDQHVKWKWYFEYRAALEKVKNPKFSVECRWGQYIPENVSKEDLERERLKRSISARKSQLSKWKNALIKYRHEYNEIFPIEENSIFLHISTKILENKTKLNELERCLRKATTQEQETLKLAS